MECELPKRVYEDRFKRFRDFLSANDLKALVVFDSLNLTYVSGFLDDTRNPVERQLACIIALNADPVLVLCEISTYHALYEVEKGTCAVKDIRFYAEHLRRVNRTYLNLQWADMVADILEEKNCLGGKIGVDMRPAVVDPALAAKIAPTMLVDASNLLREMRLIKCEEELDIFRKCGPITDVGQEILMKEIQVGKPQFEIGIEAAKAMRREAASKYPEAAILVDAMVMGSGPINSVVGVCLPTCGVGRKIEKGDTLIDLTCLHLNFYGPENERTFIVGKPTEKQTRLFDIMVEAQQRAFEAQKPGNTFADVDAAAQNVIEDSGYGEYILHRAYHGMGLAPEHHEYPYLTPFTYRRIQPGMVLSCEPGFYIPGFGSFRHSDTVIVTEKGPERVTNFPRDLQSLTVKV